MAKPVKPVWGYGDPSYAIQPSAGKQNVGWLPAEKPPYQYMNWIHLRSGEWLTYLENKAETDAPTMLRSAASATWNGSTLTFAQPIEISFRVTTTQQINRISAADSPLALADGQVLVFIKDKINASPVTLAAGSYGTLTAGQYVVVNESSLTAVNHENEVVLFRRVGTNLEIPLLGLIYPTGAVINFGQAYVGLSALATAGFLPPLASIIAHYDYNGAITPDPAYWAYCDGSTVTIGGVSRVTPDLSNRYLVGFGTEAGGDIDTATWATAAVGIANHIVDLQHDHTGPSHLHDMGNHTHPGGSLQFVVARTIGAGNNLRMYDSGGVGVDLITEETIQSGTGAIVADWYAISAQTYYTENVTGASGIPSTNNTSSSGTGNTSNALSTTQSIQPRSVRVRWIIRTN